MRAVDRAAALAILAFAAAAQAKDPPIAEEAYRNVNRALIEAHVLPRYDRFAAMGSAFATRIDTLCAAPPPRNLAPARAAFDTALGAWMGIAHIQEGPANMFMRKTRLIFWPDKRGRTGRRLDAFIAAGDAGILAPEKFPDASVALQGFGAAERLLYDGDHVQQLATAPDGLRCRLLRAIGRNVSAIGADLTREWRTDGASFAAALRRPGDPASRFGSHREATGLFVNGMFTSLKIIVDFKLDRVLGKTIERARPKRAESWRSGRSLRNIVDGLSALRDLYEGENGAAGLRALLPQRRAATAGLLSTAFERTLATARGIQGPLSRAVSDATARERVLLLARQARALKALVARDLAPALGTPLGFNALDGD